jgi:hypothetical protein
MVVAGFSPRLSRGNARNEAEGYNKKTKAEAFDYPRRYVWNSLKKGTVR